MLSDVPALAEFVPGYSGTLWIGLFAPAGVSKDIVARLQDGMLILSVADRGKGIPPEVAEKLFAPFFTTKEVGQGTGLGLSVSYFIITNNHKGQMEVHSTLGQGTCFTLRLPLAGSQLAPLELTQLEH